MPRKVGVVTFPGSLDDVDAARAVRLAGGVAVPLWHAERDLRGVDAVILPGGFSYGDYLRCGAIAAHSPVMTALGPAARAGLPVLGICNGFQILCEAHLLPGALTRNHRRRFINREVTIKIENRATPWTAEFAEQEEVTVVLKSGEGAYLADLAAIGELESAGRVVARYVGGDQNGSLHAIAGIASEEGNVVGLMPHPEHAMEALTGAGTGGRRFFESIMTTVLAR
jgi:phosphoribosylformylglycinamidine synthase I